MANSAALNALEESRDKTMCNVKSFSQEKVNRLIALNRRLAELEYWCLMRSKFLVESFKDISTNPKNRSESSDLELESKITYYRSLPLDDSEEEVLRIDFLPMPPFKWYYLNPTSEQAADIFFFLHYNWCGGLERIPALNKERICWSFHDLYDHHLEWPRILEIDRIWLDVHAIHQVETII